MLLSLVALGSDIALHALLSLTIAALFSSYLLVCGLLLWRRNTSFFQSDQPYSDQIFVGPDHLTWGPWRVPEPFGTINNAFACIYGILILFWSFWPQVTPTNVQSTNWSVLVFGVVVVFSVFWYIARAKRYFKGPIKEI